MNNNEIFLNNTCDICGDDIIIDQFGQGYCNNCGWNQSLQSIDSPNKAIYPNTISFNKAKSLFLQGKKIKPSLEDFLEALAMYSEMQFYYQNRRYGVILTNDHLINLYQWDNTKSNQTFNGEKDFILKARIGGSLVRDIWSSVEKATYMECD